MGIEISFITGIAVGIEYVSGESCDSDANHLVLDLLLIRVLISWMA